MGNKKNGYVYIAYNPSMKGLRKIGYTVDLKRRINELTNHSGVPEAFKYNYWAEFPYPDYKEVEELVHDYFECDRFNSRREFFTTDCWEIISEIESYNPVRSSISKEEKASISSDEDEEVPEKPEDIEEKEEFRAKLWWEDSDDYTGTREATNRKVKDEEKFSISQLFSELFWFAWNLVLVWGLVYYFS